jgi:adenylate cyclase
VGSVSLRGRKEQVMTWRLSDVLAHDQAPAGTPFVDREREVSTLDRVVGRLEAGSGLILLISGAAGLGKTRLLQELRGMVPDDFTWLEGRCQSYGDTSIASAIADVLRAWLGVPADANDLVVRTKLRASLENAWDQGSSRIPFLAGLLGLRPSQDEEELFRSLDPAYLAHETEDALRRWAEALGSSAPVLIALEDLHAADQRTRELVEALLAATDSAQLVIVLTSRPDPGTEGWRLSERIRSDYRHRMEALDLEPLPDQAAGELADALCPTGRLDDASRAEIVARAEGNPLYVEELVGALSEGGRLERDKSWTLSLSSVGKLLPPALDSLLVSRIQGLPDGPRRIAQVAAVAGRTFMVSTLERVAGRDMVSDGLPVLLRAEIVREIRRRPRFECGFRHGLLQEAALSTLTPARLKELYGAVAQALEAELGSDTDPELLGFYLYRSDAPDRAVLYLEAAADRAAERGDSKHELELLGRAERAAAKAGDEASQRRIGARIASSHA